MRNTLGLVMKRITIPENHLSVYHSLCVCISQIHTDSVSHTCHAICAFMKHKDDLENKTIEFNAQKGIDANL